MRGLPPVAENLFVQADSQNNQIITGDNDSFNSEDINDTEEDIVSGRSPAAGLKNQEQELLFRSASFKPANILTRHKTS